MGDDVCRGCHRFAHEVVNWNSYPEEQRVVVFERLDSLLIKIVRSKLQLINIDELKRELLSCGIIFREHSDPHCWVYALLKKTGGVGVVPSGWGFRLLPAFATTPLPEVYSALDDEFYRLCQAHYQRYLEPGIVAAKKQQKQFKK